MDLMPRRRLAAATVAVVVGVTGTGTAMACDGRGDHDSGVRAATFSMHHRWHHRRALLVAASTYLGLSKDQLKMQLASGQTLAQIAAATPGRSAAGLVDYVVSAFQTKLDALVASGKLTQAQEQTLLTKVRQGVTAVVNGTVAFAPHH